MFFKKKKKLTEKVETSIERIEKNNKIIDRLKVVYENNKEVNEKLVELQRTVKYLSPSDEKRAVDVDKKVGNLLDDMEVAARKVEKSGDNAEALDLIKKIKIALSERQ